jgi:hypothetical protein
MKRFVVLCFLMTALIGCISPAVHKTVPQFANAVTLATENSKAAFEIVDQKYVEVNTAKLVVDYDTSGFNPKNVHHLLPEQELQVRLEMLNALQEYASTLSDVSSDSKLQEFDETTKAFGTELQKMTSSDEFKKLTTNAHFDPNIAATAVNGLGTWFIERKRQKELPHLISDMQGTVKNVAELLQQDIGEKPDQRGEGGKGLRAELWNAYIGAMREQVAFIDHNSPWHDPIAKAQEIRKLVQMADEREKADNLLRQTTESLSGLVSAHRELLKAVQTKQDLHADLSALIAEGQRIKSFYDALQK